MNFFVDLSPVLKTFNIPPDQLKKIAQRAVYVATWAVYDQIRKEANIHLHKSLGAYKAGLNLPEFQMNDIRAVGVIELTGMLANMVEQGCEPFDMKEGFSKSAKVHQVVRKKKGGGVEHGWYLTIPFRYATPDAVASSAAFSGNMPKDVYNEIKGMAATRTRINGEHKQMGKSMTMRQLEMLGKAGRGTRPEIPKGGNLSGEQRAEYEHKSPKFLGLSKQEKTYAKGTGSQYVTFRRVSDLSAANSWIHKGIKARNLFPLAAENAQLEGVVARSVHRQLQALGV